MIIYQYPQHGDFMRKLLVLGLAASFFFMASLLNSQSLGDLADKEKQRREGIQNDKVITDEEAAKYKSESPATPSTPDPLSPKEDSSKTEKEAVATTPSSKADPDEPTDFEGKAESYWRKTMTEARQKVEDLENMAKTLSLKLNDFQSQINGSSDSLKRESVQREYQKGLYEQDVNKENLAKAKEALQNLENAARKSGALPGWIENPKH
jgi:hypothetical protein